MATTLPWRMKPPERVRRIEIKARSKDRAFCLGVGGRRSRGARRFDLDGAPQRTARDLLPSW
jgi:hypothetical protein